MHGPANYYDSECNQSLPFCVNELNLFLSHDLCVISKIDRQMTPCINSPKRREGSVTGGDREHCQGQTLFHLVWQTSGVLFFSTLIGLEWRSVLLAW